MAKQMKVNKEEAWDMTEKDKFEVAGKIAAILIGACPTIGDAIAVVGSLLIDLVSEANEWDDDQRADWPAPHFLVHLKWEFLDRLHRYINHQTVIRLSVLLLSHDALNSFGVA